MPMARAIQFLAPGEVKLVEVETADPSPTQAWVRMLASSCCNHPELRSFRGGSAGEYGWKYPMAPGEPGHEGVGVVESPYLGVCYDSGNFAVVGEDPVAALRAVLDRLVCTHLKDLCPATRFPDAKGFGGPDGFHFCALGDGDLPLGEIVDILRTAKGDAMHVTVEIHSAFRRSLAEADLLAFEADSVARSVTYARRVLGVA